MSKGPLRTELWIQSTEELGGCQNGMATNIKVFKLEDQEFTGIESDLFVI